MTKIKLCGLTRLLDVQAANELLPEFIGFVFAPKSRRYVSPQLASTLKNNLSPKIQAVGVFVDETVERVAELLNDGVIDLAQLHGSEDDLYVERLRTLTNKPIVKAFSIKTNEDVTKASSSNADFLLLDSKSGGSGTEFDWELIKDFKRSYFLAGGLTPNNVARALELLHPFAVDVSSGIETNGIKDITKMTQFIATVRKAF